MARKKYLVAGIPNWQVRYNLVAIVYETLWSLFILMIHMVPTGFTGRVVDSYRSGVLRILTQRNWTETISLLFM